MQLFASNLAYRYLAFALMVSQANWFCQTLNLTRNHDWSLADIRQGSSVGPVGTDIFGGSLLMDDYFFGFDAGHIANVVKHGHQPQTDAEVKRQNIELSRHLSLIDTNGAMRLATNWLGRAGVNLSVLQTNYTMNVTQCRFFTRYQPTNGFGPTNKDVVLLPIYDIVWSGEFIRKGHIRHHGPVVKVTVSGITKEMWEYHVYAEQLEGAPPIVVKDLEKVLAIPDAEFEAYDDLQRSNFVAQYGGVSTK
jgi:hypothetical protein